MAQDPYSAFGGLPTLADPVSSEPVAPTPTSSPADPYAAFGGLGTAPAEDQQIDPGAIDLASKRNAFRARSVEDLAKDDTFDPLTAYNAPEYSDPESQAKVLEAFKARQTAPVNFGKVALGIVPGIVNAGKAVGTAIGTVAGQATNILSGNKTRAATAVGELAAGAETNVTSLLNTIGKAGTFLKIRDGNGPKNDAEWKQLLLEEIDFNEAVKESAGGEGTLSRTLMGNSKYWNTIKAVVEDHGGEVDAKTVQDAAPILDPTLLIPLLAGARTTGLVAKVADAGLTFKATDTGISLVNAAGNTLIKANEGSTLFKNLSKVAGAGEAVVDTAKAAAKTVVSPIAATAEKVGAGAVKVGDAISGVKNSAIGALIGGGADLALSGVAGGLPAGGLILGAAAPKVLKTGGEALLETAGKLRGEIPPGPVWRQAVGTLKGDLAKGAAAGVGLTGDPLAAGFTALNVAGSDTDTARGESIGGQAAFGAAGHALAGTINATRPYFDIAGQVLKPGEASAPVNSTPYGTVQALDAIHDTALAKLDPGAQNSINQFREAVRGRNTQIYVVPPEDFARAYTSFKVQEAAARGETLTNDQLAAFRDESARAAAAKGVFYDNFDLGDGAKRKVVFLNSEGGALQHEGTHALLALLDPAVKKSLETEVGKRYSQEEQAQDRASYEDRLGTKISHTELLNEILAENGSLILNGHPIERLGTPKPVARAIYQAIGKLLEDLGARPAGDRKTQLGFRPDIGVQRMLENVLRAQEADARPVIEKTAKVDLSKVELNPVVRAPTAVSGSTDPRGDNIRATRADQNRFQRAAVDEGNAKAARAVDSNPNYTPEHKAAFVKIAAVIHQGGNNPHPIEVNYSAANSAEFNAGRTTRRGEQLDAATAEANGALPENVRQMTQKVLLPERFEARGNGEVQLVAKSLDKIIGNAYKLTADAHANGVANLVPYETNVSGALTERGWTDLVSDVQTYTSNHANGYAGTGKQVVVPTGYQGEIPAQNAGYKPKALPQDKADFINTIMALPPPKTTAKKGITRSGTPANVIARTLAEANGKESLKSVTSNPKKSLFDEPYNVEIAEFNPLRDELAKAGVKVRELNEVTERINLSRMSGEVKVRNDLDFSRPSTDLIRAGFMPDPRKPVRRSDPEINSVAEEYVKDSGIPYTPYKGYAKMEPDLGKALADWYDSAKSAPDDPAVKTAYDALIAQTKKQYEAMTAAGYTAEPWTGKGEPYNSSADMVKDVRDNKHLYFFKTENGFGDASTSTNNPLLADAGNGLVVNDLFRAVHDFFGHAKEGYEFGPRGEYNAFLAHSSMFDSAALPALGAETLSQNAWVNFGKHLRDAEGNLPGKGSPDFVPLQNRPFADQKVVAVPADLLERALAPKDETPQAAPQVESKTDLARYKEIGDEMVTLIKAGKADSPEFHDLWRENESIKNRNPDDPGNPPTRDFPAEDAATPEASFLPAAKVQHAATEPLPDSLGDGVLNLIHFGGSGAKELTTENFGRSGITPRSELSGAPRVYFYESGAYNKSDPVTKRNNVYGAKVSESRIYDADADPLDWSQQINRWKADDMLKDAGYVGISRTRGTGKNKFRQVELYEKTKIFPVDGPSAKFQPGEADPNADPRKPEEKLAIPSKARLGRDLNPPMDDTTYAVKPVDTKEKPTASFKPDEQSEFDIGKTARRQIAEKKTNFPESVPVTYMKNADGSLKLDDKGRLRATKIDYDLYDTDLAKSAAKGIRGEEARKEAIANAYADKLVAEHKAAIKNPALAAGANWYKIARTKIKQVFGDDSLLFAQLLGATSARTPVADNFRQSIDAYRKYKAGDYDKIIAKYKEGLAKEADGTLMEEMGAKTEAGALKAWIAEHNLVPLKSNGTRFNANSIQVLNVLAGVWAERTGGPKTPNFAGNLSGHTLAATIDVWAARNMRRLGSDPASRWRLLPESETGVSDADFHLGQAAYAKAAKKIGIDPDALQGILWFAEKDHWEKNGWTRSQSGKEKSDFNTFLSKTARKGDEVVLDESDNQPTPF